MAPSDDYRFGTRGLRIGLWGVLPCLLASERGGDHQGVGSRDDRAHCRTPRGPRRLRKRLGPLERPEGERFNVADEIIGEQLAEMVELAGVHEMAV